jgi:5'-deoxynucleotidase YfbR-like HD superfamily hydrolase
VRTSIETYTGLYFDYAKPRAKDVTLVDIARGLSNTCRFNGLVSRYYSVAEHAVLVYEMVSDVTDDRNVRFAALHHDSHEAYLGDVTTPLKRLLGAAWPRMQEATDRAIGEAIGVRFELLSHPLIKKADARALLIEACHLKASKGVGSQWGRHKKPVTGPPWAAHGHSPEQAEASFLAAHQSAKEATA